MKKIIFLIIFIILLGGIFWGVFESDFFKIKEIEVIPEGIIDKELILKEIRQKRIYGIFPLDNIFLVKEKYLKLLLAEIKKIEFKKDFKNRILKIYLKKREEVLVWCQKDKKCFSVDEEGIAFRESSFIEGRNLIYVFDDFERKISLSEKVASSQLVETIRKIYQAFKDKVKIDYFIYPEEKLYEIHLKTKEGVIFLFNLKEDISREIEALKRLIEEKKIKAKEYFDLRSLPRVYYK